ncbi:MAG: hypothetical protein SLAVMIC_00623 [uncultured marine phage]|uniref:Uncharacterized protein n=1 Tax=uncultured marine phage TaxID=707152 RepID=A0A8D9CDD5_9VIRU|nr:MAG: hypothetical protein SLAVMIC_00623 [uncultured marine phage]
MGKLKESDILNFINSLYEKYSDKEVKELVISCYLRITREEKLSHLLDEREGKST